MGKILEIKEKYLKLPFYQMVCIRLKTLNE
jgi:hypothetical protein